MFRNIGWQTNDCRSQWPQSLRRVTAAARLLGLRARIPPRAWMSVSCDCCVLSGRDICDRLITHPEESYRVWCVWVWSCSIDNEEAVAHWGLLLHWKQNKLLNSTPLHAYAFATQHYKEVGLAPRSGRFNPGKDPVPIVQEAAWAPRPVWTGAENLASTGIRSPDRPARSESLYRLIRQIHD